MFFRYLIKIYFLNNNKNELQYVSKCKKLVNILQFLLNEHKN